MAKLKINIQANANKGTGITITDKLGALIITASFAQKLNPRKKLKKLSHLKTQSSLTYEISHDLTLADKAKSIRAR